MLALSHTARRCHQQRKAKISRGFGQGIWRVRADNTSCGHRWQVKIVVTHRHIGADFELFASGQQLSIDAL